MEQPFRLGRRIITLKVRFEATLNSSQNESGTYRNHNTAGRKPTLIVKNVISFVRFDYIQSALMQMYDEPAWSNYATLPKSPTAASSSNFLPALPRSNSLSCPSPKKTVYPRSPATSWRCAKPKFRCFYEEKDTIGRRYRRMDAIGNPFCVTVDYQTKEDQTVTIRYGTP